MAGNAAAITIIVGLFSFLVNFSLHKLEEGHVGVYYRVSAALCCVTWVQFVVHRLSNWFLIQGGALLSNTSQPGFHMMIPFITSFRSVQVSFLWLPQESCLYKNSNYINPFTLLFACVVGDSANRWGKKCSVWYKWGCDDLLWPHWSSKHTQPKQR